MDRTEIIQAIARGYCTERNKSKSIDADLVTAIADEFDRLLNPPPSQQTLDLRHALAREICTGKNSLSVEAAANALGMTMDERVRLRESFKA